MQRPQLIVKNNFNR